ncbi:hypothetical protein CIK05_06215 [Bdellovibrio sp. qaytius]|nr:hypothetical protein CIK05_06215 [Bdellovibrio sp. qaytius]
MSKLRVLREHLNNDLEAFVKKGGGIIYGAPGAGKSYAIAELADSLISKGIPSIIISVEQFIYGSSKEIFEHLNENLGNIETINQIPSQADKEYGVLFLDGVDAARDIAVEANLLKAIRDIKIKLDNWNLVVTIREYDLDKNLNLKNLMEVVKTGKNKNVFKVEEFSNEELAQGLASAGFDPNVILSGQAVSLERLLKNPFNLWLFTQIFEPSDNVSYLELQTDSQLLKAYFDRVIGADVNINVILSGVTSSMVKTGTLNMELKDLNALGPKTDVDKLFSSEVFVYSKSGPSRVHFKHNILFDYLVSVYCFDSEPKKFIDYLLEDKRRSLFLQQSLKFFFFKLWDNDRPAYWALLKLMYNHKEPAVSLISKTIPFIPVITAVSNVSELDEAFKVDESFKNYFAKYLLFGFQVYPDVNTSIRPRIYETLATVLHESFIWNLSVQISNEIERSADSESYKTLSNALIIIHKFIVKNGFSASRALIANWILPGFIKSLNVDTEYKENFIRSILKSIGSVDYDIQALYRMCANVEDICKFSPKLAVEVYVSIFGYKEKSQEPVGIGSPIMPLQSNKRQDYEMCFYQLNEAYNYFLEVAPSEAIEAGIKAGEQEIYRSHIDGKSNAKAVAVIKNDVAYEVIQDYSCIWGDGHRLGEYGLQLIQKAISRIGTLIEQDNQKLSLELFEIVIANIHVAFSWNQLIELCSKFPEILSSRIAFLFASPEILRSTDLNYVIGNNINAFFTYMTADERIGVEEAVNAIAQNSPSEEIRKYDLIEKDKYILALPKQLITDENIKDRRVVLEQNKVETTFEKPFQIETGWTKYDHDDYLKEVGVNMDSPETKENLSIITKFERMELPKEKMASENSAKFMVMIEELHRNLNKIQNDKLSSEILQRTLNKINDHFFDIPEDQDPIFDIIHKLLQIAVVHPEPVFDPKYHSNFDSPSWSPSPRTEAAELICKLGLRFKHDDISKFIKKLASDEVPAVRYLLSLELFRIYYFDQNLFWDLMSERAKAEKIRSIKEALVNSLSRSYQKDILKSEQILKQLFDVSEEDHYSETLGSSIVELSVNSIGTFGSEELDKVIKDPLSYSNILRPITLRLSSKLIYTSLAEGKQSFSKSLDYSLKLISSCQSVLTSGKYKPEELQEVYRVVTEFITRLYFNSELKGIQNIDCGVAISYFEQISKLIDVIVNTATEMKYLDAGATHYFVQMMGNLVEYMPRKVIFWTLQLVKASKSGNYHIDSMAVKEVVQLVETLLSMHKVELSQNPEQLEAVIYLLDIFAEVGWPEALKATWKLDSVFR